MNTRQLVGAVCGTIAKVVIAVLVVILVYKGAMMAYDYGFRIFTEPAMSAGEGRLVSVTVDKDMSAMELGEMMYENGLVRDPKLFAVQYLLSEFREDMKSGVYELNTAMTADEMLEKMAVQVEEAEG